MYQEDVELQKNKLKHKLNEYQSTEPSKLQDTGIMDTLYRQRVISAIDENISSERKIESFKESPKNSVNFMDFSSFELALKTAEMLCKARCIPKEFWDNPSDALVVIQFGYELGLSPMMSLQNVMIVNNRPSVYGDALLAICMGAYGFIDCIETYDEKIQTAWCTMKRKGRVDITRKFSRAMAETAGLWGKRGQNGPSAWVTHPERMLQNRARGFAAKDMFPDALKGISLAEEMRDITYYDQIKDNSLKIENTAESMKKILKSKTSMTPQFENIIKDTL